MKLINTLTYSTVLSLVFALGACTPKNKINNNSDIHGGNNLKTVYFDYDSANIRLDQIANIRDNAHYVKQTSKSIVIEGHCDQRGTNEYNLALGDKRAQSAKNYMVNLGIDPQKLRTVSFGEERPSCMANNESCYSQNRRATFRRR